MKMDKTIIEIFDYLGEKLGIVIDWTQANIQPYLIDLFNRWVGYEKISCYVWIFLGIILVILPFINNFIFERKIKNNLLDREDKWDFEMCSFSILQFIFIGIMIIIGVPMVVLNILTLIKLYTIPEIYLYNLVIN